jgi:hypothetical protein
MSRKLQAVLKLTVVYGVAAVLGVLTGMIIFPMANLVRIFREYRRHLIQIIQAVEQKEEAGA